MTWSYSGDPSTSDRDALRFTIGDTNTNDQQLSDEELDYLLSQYGSVNAAALAACRALIAQYSRCVDQKTGDIDIKYSQRIAQLKTMMSEISSDAVSGSLPVPYAGGVSQSDKTTVEEDTDRVAPAFSKRMTDNLIDTTTDLKRS